MATDSTTSPDSEVRHIEMTPGICGGRPRIAGSRIRVQDIVVWHERMGTSADEIVSRYPHLSLAGVYAALAYYHDHRQAIEADMERGEALAEEIRRQYPSKLPAKLADEAR
jgi:uncharacterized protein (DUF433 family)